MTSNANCYDHWRCPADCHAPFSIWGQDIDAGKFVCHTCEAQERVPLYCKSCTKLRPYRYREITQQIGRPLGMFEDPHDKWRPGDFHPVTVLLRALALSGFQPGTLRQRTAKGTYHSPPG